MLRFMTAGESHGKCLIALLDGLPAGLKIDLARINDDLARRQQGYGRGGRMRIEQDQAEIISGLKQRRTLGSPLALRIENRDDSIERLPPVTAPRPGHADLSGSFKYGFSDARCCLERASARETAARVAAGSVCRQFLAELGISVLSRIVSVGGKSGKKNIQAVIDTARKKGDTLGGIFEVRAKGIPAGLGTYAQYDRRLDGRLALALVSIPAVKGVEFGLGFQVADRPGSKVHDPIYYSKNKGFFHRTNNAGGIEGGISNGEDIVCRCAMKPIATLMKPLASVNMRTGRPAGAATERSDVCAVESAAVVGEAMVSLVLCEAVLERFGQDRMSMIKSGLTAWRNGSKKLLAKDG